MAFKRRDTLSPFRSEFYDNWAELGGRKTAGNADQFGPDTHAFEEIAYFGFIFHIHQKYAISALAAQGLGRFDRVAGAGDEGAGLEGVEVDHLLDGAHFAAVEQIQKNRPFRAGTP